MHTLLHNTHAVHHFALAAPSEESMPVAAQITGVWHASLQRLQAGLQHRSRAHHTHKFNWIHQPALNKTARLLVITCAVEGVGVGIWRLEGVGCRGTAVG